MEAERRHSADSVHTFADRLSTSVRLVRRTSQILTGGAEGLHHSHGADPEATPGETTPIMRSRPPLVRQQSANAMSASQTPDDVQHRMRQDFEEVFQRNIVAIIISGIALLAFMITAIVLLALAAIAALNNHDKACDQPLKYYLLISLLWSQVPAQVVTRPNLSLTSKIALTVVLTLPAWCLLGWGFYMVDNAVTCPKTNPNLFYPTRRYIYFQIVLTALRLVAIMIISLGVRRFLLYFNALMASNRRGCEGAIHNLPKVQADSKELLADDGEIMACPICMSAFEPLSDEGGAVRTPCTHYFHEECLATWCQSHLDCPLCRQTLGEPDKVDNNTPEEP